MRCGIPKKKSLALGGKWQQVAWCCAQFLLELGGSTRQLHSSGHMYCWSEHVWRPKAVVATAWRLRIVNFRAYRMQPGFRAKPFSTGRRCLVSPWQGSKESIWTPSPVHPSLLQRDTIRQNVSSLDVGAAEAACPVREMRRPTVDLGGTLRQVPIFQECLPSLSLSACQPEKLPAPLPGMGTSLPGTH